MQWVSPCGDGYRVSPLFSPLVWKEATVRANYAGYHCTENDYLKERT